jgi:hypothetical protein
MKALVVAAALAAMITTASAQFLKMPKTITFTDKATGEKVGTATFSDNHVYLRDKKGELYAQIVIEKNGKQTLLDPSGNPLDPSTLKLPLPTLDDQPKE